MTLVPASDQQYPGNGYSHHVTPYQPQYGVEQARDSQPAPRGVMRLTEWAHEASAAYELAKRLVTTSFVPRDFRGKPDEAAAAILAGSEMGLSPMASLRAIYLIHGTPGMYAKTMRAVVQSHGHEIWVDDATSTRVVVKGRRKGSDRVESSTWTADRAKTAKLTSNDQYTKNPQNMLTARATAEVCWLIASDALHGIAASVEELESGDFADGGEVAAASPEEEKPARRTAKRKPLEKAEGAEPPLPGTIERQPDVPVAEPVSAPPVDGVSRAQVQRMQILFRQKGIDDRALRLQFVAEKVGREVATSNDLTALEGETVIAALTDLPDIPAGEPQDEVR